MKLFVQDHNQVLAEVKKEFELTNRLEEADKVILWNDVNHLERGIIKYAHSLKKEVIVMQHGRKGTSKYYSPFKERIQADKLLVWGDFDRRSLEAEGQEAKRIKVVGSTIFQHLKPRKAHRGINVVFCPEHWDREVEENTRVRNELRKLKGVNVVTKLIEAHDKTLYDNPIVSHRDSPLHLDTCVDVLTTADIVVGVSESTFELLAQAMNIPVVIMEEWEPKTFGGDERYYTYRRVISPGSKRTTVKNLRETIKHQLANPDELKQERLDVAIDEGGIHLDALKLIKEEIYG
jgi:hypothetical protein